MTPAAGVRWRPLVVLTVVVLGVHALALRGAPESLRWTRTALPFVVRVRDTTVPSSATTTATPTPAPSLSPRGSPPASPPPSRTSTSARTTELPPIASAIPRSPARSRQAVARAPPASAVDTAVPPSPTLAVPTVPASARWHYVVSAQWHGMAVAGDAVLAWHQDGTAYDAALVVDTPAQARTQRSTGELAADGLRPLRFSDRQRSEEAAHFDRAQGRITFSSNRPDVALRPGAQDRLSLLVQLMALASANPDRFVPGATLALQVAGTRDADEWQFTVEGRDVLALPTGPTETVKLARQLRGAYDTRMELWLAPGQAYALVRLRLTPPNADWLDLQWSGTDKR